MLFKVILLGVFAIVSVQSATVEFNPEFARGTCILKCLNKTISDATADNPPPAAYYYRNTYMRAGDTVMKCIADCITNVTQHIQDWLIQLPDKEQLLGMDSRSGAHVNNMRESLMAMDRELISLKNMFEMPTLFWDLLNMIPTFPVYQPIQPVMPPFTAHRAPGNTNFLQSMLQSLRNLLDHVIQRNQELVQLLIGCSNGTTSASSSSSTPAMSSTVRIQPSAVPVKIIPSVVPSVVPSKVAVVDPVVPSVVPSRVVVDSVVPSVVDSVVVPSIRVAVEPSVDSVPSVVPSRATEPVVVPSVLTVIV